MTEQLEHLLRQEAERLDVPPPPTDVILAAGRRRRRTQRARTALAAAASVAVVAGGLAGVATLDGQDGRGEAPGVATAVTPTPTPTSTPTPSPTPSDDPRPDGSLELSGSRVGDQPFGTDADEVVADVTALLGEPDVTVGPTRYARIRGNGDTWFENADDAISPSWEYPVASVSCWRTLCLVFGGSEQGSLALRGWELAELNRWSGFEPVRGDWPDVHLAGSGIRLGDSWEDLRRAYPGVVVDFAHGGSVAVGNPPWPAIFDGVAAWRLSGQLADTRPWQAPEGAVVTRLSAGEGPEPGCC